MSPHFWQRNQFFFFNDTATTEIYTLSLHDALPIWLHRRRLHAHGVGAPGAEICDSRPTAVLADSDWAYGGGRGLHLPDAPGGIFAVSETHCERSRRS